jgi:transposase-like protein
LDDRKSGKDSSATKRWYAAGLTIMKRTSQRKKATIDQIGVSLAAHKAIGSERDRPFRIRQNKYVNEIFQREDRVIEHRTRPMLGFSYPQCEHSKYALKPPSKSLVLKNDRAFVLRIE